MPPKRLQKQRNRGRQNRGRKHPCVPRVVHSLSVTPFRSIQTLEYTTGQIGSTNTRWYISKANINNHYSIAGQSTSGGRAHAGPDIAYYHGHKVQSLKVIVENSEVIRVCNLTLRGFRSQGKTWEFKTNPGSSNIGTFTKQQFPDLSLFLPYSITDTGNETVLELSGYRCTITLRFQISMLTPDFPGFTTSSSGTHWTQFQRLVRDITSVVTPKPS